MTSSSPSPSAQAGATHQDPEPPSPQSGRGGTITVGRAITLLSGTGVAAVTGFALAVVVGRSMGAERAGVFFTLVAFVNIATAVQKVGTDTTQIWQLPRLLAERRAREAWRPPITGLVASLGVSAVVAGVLLFATDPVVTILFADSGGDLPTALLDVDVPGQVRWAAVSVLTFAPLTVLIAATRGLGQVWPFVLLQNLGIPAGRLVAVAVALSVGAGGVGVMAAWSLPSLAVFGVALVVLFRQLRRAVGEIVDPVPPRPRRATATEFWRFSSLRWVAAVLEASMVSINTVLVAKLMGPAAAGVFGALSRFITSGQLGEASVRVLVGPRFAVLLARGDTRAVAELNAVTTPWIMLISWPIFVVLAAGAPVLMTAFGSDFEGGSSALALLAASLCVSQLAGTVPTVLLMSGRSELQLMNRVASVVTVIVLNLVLVPHWGIVGAAAAWAAGLLLNAGLAVAEVTKVLEIRLRWPNVARCALLSALCFGLPTAMAVHLLGGGLLELLAAGVLGAIPYALVVWCWRDRLHLASLTADN